MVRRRYHSKFAFNDISAPNRTVVTRTQGRNWQVTWQGVTRESEEHGDLREHLRNLPWAVYVIMGYETAPTTGQKHMHAFIQSRSPRTMQTMLNWGKKWGNPHIEICRGSAKQNIEYCKKEGDFEEHGESKTNQGQRTDIESATRLIDEGATSAEVARSNPELWVKFHKGFISYEAKTKAAPRVGRSACIWLWGKAGTGKSYFAKSRHPGRLYIKEPGHKWWDGYVNQQAALMDDMDFRDGFWATKEAFRHLLRLADEGPAQVEYKGGMLEFNSEFLYITSEHPPSFYWSGNELAQVTSRFGIIREMTGAYESSRKESAGVVARSKLERVEREQFVARMRATSAGVGGEPEDDDNSEIGEAHEVAMALAESVLGEDDATPGKRDSGNHDDPEDPSEYDAPPLKRAYAMARECMSPTTIPEMRSWAAGVVPAPERPVPKRALDKPHMGRGRSRRPRMDSECSDSSDPDNE